MQPMLYSVKIATWLYLSVLLIAVSAFWIDYSFLGREGLIGTMIIGTIALIYSDFSRPLARHNLLNKSYERAIVAELRGGNIFRERWFWINILTILLLVWLFNRHNHDLSYNSQVLIYFIALVKFLSEILKGLRLLKRPAERVVLFEDAVVHVKEFEQRIAFTDIDEVIENEKQLLVIGTSRLPKIEIKYALFPQEELQTFLAAFKQSRKYWIGKTALSKRDRKADA